MKDKIRLTVMIVALVGVTVGAILVARHVTWGGEPTTQGTLSGVRPGGDDIGAITAYHYRVTSRYGYYVKLHVTNAEVSVSGPRLAPALYAVFIGGQVWLSWLVWVALLAAAIYLNWRWLLVAAGLWVAGFVFAMACAGGLWAWPDVSAVVEPGTLDKVSFPLSAVRDVKVGPGWDRQGIGFVLGGVVNAVNDGAKDRTVSFLAPDPTTKRYVTYAVCCYTSQEAANLANSLRSR
jgi:hypothetical protein